LIKEANSKAKFGNEGLISKAVSGGFEATWTDTEVEFVAMAMSGEMSTLCKIMDQSLLAWRVPSRETPSHIVEIHTGRR